MFKKAIRKQSKIRLAISGPSGCGKTYSALQVAFGLAQGGRVAMLDTEHGSGELYSDLGDYDVAQVNAPYSPERYIEVIAEAEKQGYAVIVIDSLSHEWFGTGGVLEIHDSVVDKQKVKNSFTAWAEVTPRHNRLVEKILACRCHVIATMRSKTAYEIQDEEDYKGRKKKTIKRIGTVPVQREGMEYEFGIMFEQDQETHLAHPIKNRTPLFQDGGILLAKEHGEEIAAWISGGEIVLQNMKETYAKAGEFLDVPQQQINMIAGEVIAAINGTGQIPDDLVNLPIDHAAAVRDKLRELGKLKAASKTVAEKPADDNGASPSMQEKNDTRRKAIDARIGELQLDRESVKHGLKALFGIDSTGKCGALTDDEWRRVMDDLPGIAEAGKLPGIAEAGK